MLPAVSRLPLVQNYLPHGACLLWQPGLLWLDGLSDAVIAAAYCSFVAALIHFVSRRHDPGFRGVFVLAGLSILACGATHVMGVVTLCYPAYWTDGLIRFCAAVVLVGTAVAIWQVIPSAPGHPGETQPDSANSLTDHEIAERQDAAAELQLERHVTERTAALEAEVARRQAEDALQEARDELLRGDRLAMISELSAFIAHETNQPLGAIVSNGQACLRLLAGPVPDIQEVREALEDMISDAKRASDVLRRLRALGKNTLPERKPLDLNDMVDEVLALIRPELRAYRISAQAMLDSSLPLVQADRFQLQQVVLNLVMNAIEAMRDIDNRPRTLNVKSGLGKDHHAFVIVADNGTGLPKDSLDHIFDILFTTKPRGTGMGLSICNSIVHAHGGRLSVAPGTPFGAVFSFSLPAVAKPA